MEASEAIRISGLLRVVIGDRAVRDRLRQRPDWRAGLYQQLVRLRDPLPSDVFAVLLDTAQRRANLDVRRIPRLGRIGISPLHLGALQIEVRDGELTTVVDKELMAVDPAILAAQASGSVPELPVPAGQIAFVVWVEQDATAAEWKEVMAARWADIQLLQRAQRRARRARDLPITEQHLREVRAEMDRRTGPERDFYAARAAELEDRLAELTEEEGPLARVRIDLPFRELVWLREFLGAGTKPADIAAAWEEQLERWRDGDARPHARADPVLAAAYRECLRKTHGKGHMPVETPTVERGLKRWLGKHLSPPPTAGRDRR